jgi:D-alanyl-D-alanine carboxypeptidase
LLDSRAEFTVRQLLQHTSGLADYDDELAADLTSLRSDHRERREVVDLGLKNPALTGTPVQWLLVQAGRAPAVTQA